MLQCQIEVFSQCTQSINQKVLSGDALKLMILKRGVTRSSVNLLRGNGLHRVKVMLASLQRVLRGACVLRYNLTS